MSTLDQAFIRAYQAGRSAPQVKPEPASVAAPHAAPAPHFAAFVTTAPAATAAVEAKPEPKPAPRSKRTRHFVDAAHAGPQAPHSGLDAPPFARTAYEPIYAHTALQRERSSYGEVEAEVVTEESTTDAANEVIPEFRATFETERFHWPRNVEVLIASAGNEFAQFTAELEQRIAVGRKTLAVTGSTRGEGRSTLTLALARLLSNRGLSVVVVDADLRQPQLAEMLGIRPELGWDDVYAEKLPVNDAMIESPAERITLLPMRSGFSNPRALAGNRTLAGIIDQLKQHYDSVLLDVGALPDDQDTIDLAAALTGCKLDDALVVRDRRTVSPKDVQAVCRRLAVLGVHHCDIAENFTELQGY